MNVKELVQVDQNLRGKRSTLMSLWQETAINFYPERADFTLQRVIGQDFAALLMTSYPILARRELGDAFGSMLRPTAKPWFHVGVANRDDVDLESKRWLEMAEKVMRKAMYDRLSGFIRATKEGDNDFAAFGQCVLSVERTGPTLLYRCWHLRDVVWSENERGQIGQVFRKWKTDLRTIDRLFPGKLPASAKRDAEKNPLQEAEVLHIVVDSDLYEGGKFKNPKTSIFWSVTHEKILEEKGINSPLYLIPRWQTVSGSQYAYSPATVAALPEARLIQAMTTTLLEAGEKYTNPPMIAVEEAIRSDISLYAGGITWVEKQYDERLGEVLRPLTQDRSGMPLGVEMQRDSRDMIRACFFLNKLAMPQRAAKMTAYEVGQRVQEYIRQALPIFEPMEIDYNGALCEATFYEMLSAGAFGSPLDMPRGLRGARMQFRFESPLHDAIDAQLGQKLLEMKGVLAEAAAVDPQAIALVDVMKAARDALVGTGVPATWLRTDSEMQKVLQAAQAKAQQQQMLANMQAGANIAKTVGDASQSLGFLPAPSAAQPVAA